MFSPFGFPAFALVALAGALAVLRHRFRQRSLQKIPGPPSPSFFLGPWASRTRRLRLLVPRMATQDIREGSARLWFFWGHPARGI